VDPVPDPILFFCKARESNPGPLDLYSRTLTTRPQRDAYPYYTDLEVEFLSSMIWGFWGLKTCNLVDEYLRFEPDAYILRVEE
jgi:hypothetical protein